VKVTIFDYGAGNMHSLAKAIAADGVDVSVEPDPVRAVDTDLLVLPGVGAFGAAAARLATGRDLMRSALGSGLPCLGICLGMQLLFEGSDEATGDLRGLGVIPGHVSRLEARRVPQIGWNTVEQPDDALLDRAPLDYVYYANSYVCRPSDPNDGAVRAWSTHEADRFPAIVRVGRTVGVQFHPEKSSAPGRRFLRAVLEEARP
jgi:glutamine amidotransferase